MTPIEKILVIEDDKGLCELVVRHLDDCGFATTSANTFAAALKEMQKQPFGLLLIDFKIDDVELYELLDEMAEKEINIPFVVMTGYSSEKIAVEVMKRGALDYITKDDAFFDRLEPVLHRVTKQLETRRREAEAKAALRESLERFSNLVQQSIDPVFIAGLPGNIENCNMAYINMFLGEALEPGDSNLFRVFEHEKDRRRFKDSIHTKGRIVNFEVALMNAAGESRNCLLNAQLLSSEDGTIIGYQGFIKDISERKRLELLLKGQQRELERKNIELQETVQALKTFSDSISNDLRTPIWRLDGFCQILEDLIPEEANPKLSQVINQIRSDGKRITQFINDAFRLSNISRSEVNRSTFNLAGLAREIRDELSMNTDETRIEFRIQESMEVSADRRLTLIMMRLLLYYTWFYCQVCDGDSLSLEKDGDAIVITVHSEDLNQVSHNSLFVPLYQAYLIKDYFHTGVSLITVQRVLNLHGGRMWTERDEDTLRIFFTFG